MMFDINAMTESLDRCFNESGAKDLRDFIGRHLKASKWIVASDFNTNPVDTAHDVYAFACYPVETDLNDLRQQITTILPKDFKETHSISREQKAFFEKRPCFCFVFIIDRETRYLRSGNHELDLGAVRIIIDRTIIQLEGNGTGPAFIAPLRRLKQDALRKSFPVALFEKILLLSCFNAYVCWKIAANTPVETISWFPDRDKMVEFSDGIFHLFSHITFHSYWQTLYPLDRLPKMGYPEPRATDKGLAKLRDELIRVPDFLSAVVSRWEIKRNIIIKPDNASPRAMRRYVDLIRGWHADNNDIWICNPRIRPDGYVVGRLIVESKRKNKKMRRIAGRT